tara:strand:+ start:500 stop:622 length:123 start_codon:yes stop_codon:yes gene_type:complete
MFISIAAAIVMVALFIGLPTEDGVEKSLPTTIEQEVRYDG